uniref:Beta-lactamase-related domain-containing protein n=1 Tax=Branchiostoma floridae TaxID=7739 RepID=C3YN87_BRAFL|eukprot:XP_002602181.1 hypothetical protein BRAFLDRAFT_76869 [Branchiostoma floridae]
MGGLSPYLTTKSTLTQRQQDVQKRKGHTSPFSTATSSDNTNDRIRRLHSSYEEHLQHGCKALQTGDLDKAEQSFAAALKSVHIQGQHMEEVETLYMLGRVYLKRGIQSKDGGDFTKAAALCNAALVRSSRDDIEKAIKEITHAFVKDVLKIEQKVDSDDTEKHKLMLKADRGYVQEEITRIEQEVDPYSLDDEDPKIKDVEMKRVEAIKALCQTLVHQRKVFIAGLVDECMGVMRPPPSWGDLGDHRKAVNYYEQALEMKRSIFGEDTAHPDIAASLNNLGNAWRNLGNHRKAISYYEQSIQMKRSIYGEDTAHLDIAASLNNLGATWRNLGDYRKAISYYEQAIQMKRSIYGEDTAHPDIAASLNNLGATWRNLGDHRKAISYYEQALEMTRSIYALSNLGDHRKAISYYEQALEMTRSIYGEDTAHPDIATSLNNMGNTWGDLGDHRKAISYYEQALQMMRSIYGKNTAHPDIVKSLNNLCVAWREVGDYRKAISYYEQSIQMKRSIYGEDTAHPDIAGSLNNLGATWRNLGDHRKAISYYEQALEMTRSIYGKGTAHSDIAGSLNNLGNALSNLGDHRKAISYYEQALEMTRSIYGEDTAHPDIATSLNNMGNTWGDLGDHRKAISYYEQSLQMMRSIYVGQVLTMTSPDLQQRLQDLDTFIQNLMTCESRPVVGLTVSVVKDGQTIFAQGYGQRDLQTGQAVDNRTLFGVGSISKSFTSAPLAAILGERKDVSWDTVLTDILGPSFRFRDQFRTEEATIRDLLAHKIALESLWNSLLIGKDHWLNSTTACTYPAPWWKTRRTRSTAVPKISSNFPRDKRDYEGNYGNHPTGNLTISLIGNGVVLPTKSANQILLRAEEPLEYIPTIVADVEDKGGKIFSLSLQSYPPEPPVVFERGLKLTDPDPTCRARVGRLYRCLRLSRPHSSE